HQAIDRITANGSTALFAGVSKGAGEVRKFLDKTRVNRIILLSDGLANVGPSSPGELEDLGRSLGSEGIAVTTLGLGLDYNEDLMTRLAQRSDGNHMFVENTTDLAKAYSIEFGDVMSVVAQDVDIRITCADGVRPVRVLGRDASIDGSIVRTSLNQLVSEQTKYLILEVEAPARKSGDSAPIAEVSVSYLDLETDSRAQAASNVFARYTASAAEVEQRTDPAIMASVIQQIGNERNELAMSLRDQGRIDEARDLFLSNEEFLSSNSIRFNSPVLNEDAEANRFSADNLDKEQWVRERKAIQEKQFQTKQQSVGLKK
ncbi:MAG: VWA domain-containing protein, partial [Candidatus Hydrogenedentes bacterium]|nr:VWA domain-containing protein [Candidatus Hydrogenedentota bacterium]